MTLIQRIVLWLGCHGLILVWLMPPSYHLHADGTRLETSWHWVWSMPHEWSVNAPILALRILTVVLVTFGFYLVFRTNLEKEGSK